MRDDGAMAVPDEILSFNLDFPGRRSQPTHTFNFSDGSRFRVKRDVATPSALSLLFCRLLGPHAVLFVELQLASSPPRTFFTAIAAPSRVREGKFATPVSFDELRAFSALLRVSLRRFRSDGAPPADGSSVPVAYAAAASGVVPHHLYCTCPPSGDVRGISIRADSKIIDVRRAIASNYVNQVCVMRRRGGLVCDFSPALTDDRRPFEVVWVRLPRDQIQTLKLRSPKENKFYYVDVYSDDTIGNVKMVLQHKHGLDRTRMLISQDVGDAFSDDVPIWNLDVSVMFLLTIAQDGAVTQRHPTLAPPAAETLSASDIAVIKAPWAEGDVAVPADEPATPESVMPGDNADFDENIMKLVALEFGLNKAMRALRARKCVLDMALRDLLES
jgi:hypothetical protein